MAATTGGVFYAGDEVGATEEGGGEGAVEGVAGGGGVDGFDAVRGDESWRVARAECDVAAAVAEFEQHVAAAFFIVLRGVFRGLSFADQLRCIAAASEFAVSVEDPVDAGEQRRGERACRSGSSTERDIFAAHDHREVLDRFEWDFELRRD